MRCEHGRTVELATLTIDESSGLPFAKIYKPHEIDAGTFALSILSSLLFSETRLTGRARSA